MSAVTSRPRVRSVADSNLAATAGAVAIAALAARALRQFARIAVESPAPLPDRSLTLLSRSAVLEKLKTLNRPVQTNAGPQTIRRAKVEALRSLEALDLAVSPPEVSERIDAVLHAQTLAAAQAASSALRSAVVESHDGLFLQALSEACATASKAAGFGNVQQVPSQAGGFRLVATDENGRALVTEFAQPVGSSAPRLETEVIGVLDGSCQQILDRFDQALEAQGVRSGPSDRRWTGGVCSSPLALELIARRLTKSTQDTVRKNPSSSPARRPARPKTRMR